MKKLEYLAGARGCVDDRLRKYDLLYFVNGKYLNRWNLNMVIHAKGIDITL